MTIAYKVGNGLYLNITNKCSCACVFCLRMEKDGVGDGENLWLEYDPTTEEIIRDLEAANPPEYEEVVFCGYGEPTERLEEMLHVCRYLKEHYPQIPIRLNTNGLPDLRWEEPTAPKLAGLVDTVSISLNASTPELYTPLVRPTFGEFSFQAMLSFASHCREVVPHVVFTVVDIIGPQEVAACRRVAEALHIPLRVRPGI